MPKSAKNASGADLITKFYVRESGRGEFIHDWLTAGPSRFRSGKTHEIDIEKRLTTVLEALHKETNIVKFKPRK